jgi:prepilin-type processing-associated H-X9-DG protein
MRALCPYLNIKRADGAEVPWSLDSGDHILTLVPSATIFKCPSEPSNNYVVQYGWNSRIRYEYDDNLLSVKRPDSIFIWMDARHHSLGYNAFGQADSNRWVRNGSRHSKGNNICWIDGHVTWVKIVLPSDIKTAWFY